MLTRKEADRLQRLSWRRTLTHEEQGALSEYQIQLGRRIVGDESEDRARANQLREEMQAALQPVVDILERARQQGFVVGFNLNPDPLGRQSIQYISVARHY